MIPIRIKAQVLRRPLPFGHGGVTGLFSLMPDRGDDRPGGGQGRRHGWRQSDVRRAIAAAEQAGLLSYRVEIEPDGTISIIVGAPEDTANPDPYGELLG